MDKAVNVEKNNTPLSLTKVKKENFDEEIKEYAETAMNELLGWYGYGASREEIKPPTINCHSNSNTNSSNSNSPKPTEGCGWCGKPVEENNGLSAGTNTFCSELCFSQSRRANFKKNKTCDWCRHVRHTVSYVDFQDGASQLQFCSDKCLNQYKMHIFCRETRAHLEMHPHLSVDDSGSGLITPELWMKNCRSPESRSPSLSESPKESLDLPQTSPLPLITVAHPSKLLANSVEQDVNRRIRNGKSSRKQRKRCSSTVTQNFAKPPMEFPQDLRVRQSPINCENHHIPLVNRLQNPYVNHQFQDHEHRIPPPHTSIPPFSNPLPNPPPSKPNSNIVPPVTVLVPYPIIVPVPLPIPIPLPIKSFLQAEQCRRLLENRNNPNINEIITDEKPQQNGNANSSPEDDVKIHETHETETVTIEESPDEKEVVQNGLVRPLRKRKRVVDTKSKVFLKNKKTLST